MLQHLDELEEEWKALFEVSPTASPPLRWEWVREWWRIYGPVYGDGGRGLRIITSAAGRTSLASCPCTNDRREAPGGPGNWDSSPQGAAEFEETSTEYLDLLHAPARGTICVYGRISLDALMRWNGTRLTFPTCPSSLPSWTYSAVWGHGFAERGNPRRGHATFSTFREGSRSIWGVCPTKTGVRPASF